MKTLQKGFIVPLVIILIALALVGGVYTYIQTKKPVVTNSLIQTPPTVQTSDSQTKDWNTYTSNQHGYTIQYPADVKVALIGTGTNYSIEDSMSSTTRWYASTCVEISADDWYINISADGNFSNVMCGTSGLSADSYRGTDTLIVDGNQITTNGWMYSAGRSSFFDFGFKEKINTRIEYGVSTSTNTVLSAQEYQTALDSVHAVLSTFKLIPSFIPVAPPPNGRG